MKIKFCEPYEISLIHVKKEFEPNSLEKIPHSHEHCELFVHIKGNMDIFVENSIYHLFGGEIRNYASGEFHCGSIYQKQLMEWYQISIPTHALDCFSDHDILMKCFFGRNHGEKNIIISEKHDEIVHLLSEACRYYESKNELCESYCKSAVLNALCLINNSQYVSEKLSADKGHVGNIIDIVNSEYRTLMTVKDISEKTFFSISYINKIFFNTIGTSPYKYLIGKKLDEAKKTLGNGSSVADACYASGFKNYSNFITLFHKNFGITPNKYRKKFMHNH